MPGGGDSRSWHKAVGVGSSQSLCRGAFPGAPQLIPVLFPQVVFGRKLPSFSSIALHQLQHEKKYDIYFMDAEVYALYR